MKDDVYILVDCFLSQTGPTQRIRSELLLVYLSSLSFTSGGESVFAVWGVSVCVCVRACVCICGCVGVWVAFIS